MIQNRALLLRGNRFLGSTLVDRGLISVDDLENANEKLVEMIQNSLLKQASILNILIFDLQALNEADLISHMVEEQGMPLIDLQNYDLSGVFDKFPEMDLPACWATWTIPFDRVDSFVFLATSYYLSQPVVKYWEDTFDNQVLWYTASVQTVTGTLESLEAEKAKIDAAAAKQAELQQTLADGQQPG